MCAVIEHSHDEDNNVHSDSNLAEIDTARVFWLHHWVCDSLEKGTRWKSEEDRKDEICAGTPESNGLIWVLLILKIDNGQNDAQSNKCKEEENEEGSEKYDGIGSWISVGKQEIE